jgi:membrane protein DedA with SNARE-associated domain
LEHAGVGMYDLFLEIVGFIESLGYLGIFVMTFIESTFVPIPSEITLIPAGFLVADGRMSFWLVSLSSLIGTLGGSLTNYFIAKHFGRKLLLNYGQYLFIDEERLKTIEFFFQRHGAISTFSGRLLPGLKHFISFPAGLARMNLMKFSFYTAMGGALWNTMIIGLGYLIGENNDLIKQNLKYINIGLILFIVLVIAIYMFKHKRDEA